MEMCDAGDGMREESVIRSESWSGRTARQTLCVVLMLAGVLAARRLNAQNSGKGSAPAAGQSQPSGQTQDPGGGQQPAKPKQPANAFPEDESTVPVIPTKAPDLPDAGDSAKSRMPLPPDDSDPVRSPEQTQAAAEDQEHTSSSSLAGMGNLLPDANDDDTQPGKRNRKGQQIEPEHQETAAEDENVGSYYLSNKDWTAALSRYQSALVLDPDNPDVYWGLAEAERHTGDFADARANYMKVMEYDPGSHHAKEAKKALEDPEIANAKVAAKSTSQSQ